MNKESTIYVAGHTGLLGSAIVRRLKQDGYDNLILRTHRQMDLTDQFEVNRFFRREHPEYVFLCAALVGGIHANACGQADFLYQNLQIQNNIIWSAFKNDAERLLFIGSSCIYPQKCEQPMKEEYLMQGPPEPLNEGYAMAKISGLLLCKYIYRQYGSGFISCMLPNIYGPNDNFDQKYAHVISGLIVRMHEAKEKKERSFVVWGTGNVKREFIYSDDAAAAAIWMMKNYFNHRFMNVGTGKEYTIKQVVEIVARNVGYNGAIVYDHNKPDGAVRKLLDGSMMVSTGWLPKVDLEQGIALTYSWYQKHVL
jgi:GDP-L-fucose synthase